MMKAEFERLAGVRVTPDEYAIVERVYTWHPSIPDAGGKLRIAQLFKLGGMDLMRDMDVRASALENSYASASASLREEQDIANDIRKRIAAIDEQVAQLNAEKARMENDLTGHARKIISLKEEIRGMGV